MDREQRKVRSSCRARLKGLAIEQGEAARAQQIRDAFIAVAIEVNHFDSFVIKEPRRAVQHWKFVLFDIDF